MFWLKLFTFIRFEDAELEFSLLALIFNWHRVSDRAAINSKTIEPSAKIFTQKTNLGLNFFDVSGILGHKKIFTQGISLITTFGYQHKQHQLQHQSQELQQQFLHSLKGYHLWNVAHLKPLGLSYSISI